VELGPSYSGAIVVSNRVFSTETIDKKSERVRALDRQTGKELWRREWEGAMSVPFFAKANGDWIRATPACDGEVLVVAGMRDVLVALDVADGTVRWRKDFVAELKSALPDFGFVSSPLISGDAVYVQAGGGVVRLDKKTGEIRWRSLESKDGMMGSAFSSPVLADIAGRNQLVVQTRAELVGLDPATGSVLWRQPVEAFRGMNILTPTVLGDRLFASAYGGRTLAWDVKRTGETFSVTPAWEFKAQGYMTSPVVVDGFAYLHLRNQRALCINLETGKEAWTTSESFGKYWSLVANRKRLLALDQKGDLLLLAANPERFEIVDRRKVTEEEAWAHLAVTEEGLYVRDLKGLTAWNWTAPAATTASVGPAR
jgi:outer membrane protein assembly factor BamB